MRWLGPLLAGLLATPAGAATPAPAPGPLAGVAFLVGAWSADDGKVPDVHGVSKGRSVISWEANGHAILRRDETQVFDAAGRPLNSFAQVMLIYPEGGVVKADYGDGEGHVIHYAAAELTPGRSVTFVSTPGPGPVFRLTYVLQDPATMAVSFGMTPPGGAAVQPIASGTLRRAGR